MREQIAMSCIDASQVVERMLQHYGAGRVRCVERRSEHIYQGQLTDGRYVAAIVDAKGSLIFLDLSEVGV